MYISSMLRSFQRLVLKNLIYKIADVLGSRDLIHIGALPAPEHEPALIVGDNRRLTEEVGWRPGYDLDTGIEQAIRYWQERKNA